MKQRGTRYLLLALGGLLLLLVLLTAGCGQLPAGEAEADRPRPETREWDGLELDQELREALERQEVRILWRIPTEFRPAGEACVRPYTALDCEALWPELQSAVFPMARLQSNADAEYARVLEYADGTERFALQLNAMSVFLEGLPPVQAQKAVQEIGAFLERKTGFPQQRWEGPAPEGQGLICGTVIDGIPVDVKMDSDLPVSCVFAQPNGKLVLWNPIIPGEARARYDLADCLSPETLRKTAEDGWRTTPPVLAELTDCSLIYYLDANGAELRPGWSLTGTGYRFDTGEMLQAEILIDAVNGKLIRGGRQKEAAPALLGGLPYEIQSVGYQRLLAYLLLLLLGSCAGGVPAARLLLKPHSFSLVRAGWRRWFARVLGRCFLSVLAFCGLLLAPSLLRCPEWRTLWAWLLFTLHMEMLAAVQVLLTALFENAAAAAASVTLTQTVSLLLSSRLPGAWALLLPGNWGALARTAEFELPDSLGSLHGGFPLWAAAALNTAVLLAIGSFGWRPIRRRNVRK